MYPLPANRECLILKRESQTGCDGSILNELTQACLRKMIFDSATVDQYQCIDFQQIAKLRWHENCKNKPINPKHA